MMKFFYVNEITGDYYEFDEAHDFEQYPAPLDTVECPRRPMFATWDSEAKDWSIDSVAKAALDKTKILRAIKDHAHMVLQCAGFDDTAQLMLYASRNTTYSALLDEIHNIWVFWDEINDNARRYDSVSAAMADCVKLTGGKK
jgi:REP element-mobilizing transposase RayT